MAKKEVFDVCVVGTGAGGGVMIDELTSAGFKVVALERGKMWNNAEFMEHDELSSMVRKHQVWAPDLLETLRETDGEKAIPGQYSMLAHGVGGSSVHWHGAAWRFRPDEMKVLSTEGSLKGANLADWPISYEELEPFYDKAEQAYGVAGNSGSNPWGAPRSVDYPNPPHPYRSGSLAIIDAAKKLGLDPFSTPTAINSRHFGGRPACMNGGMCGYFGCPINAKASSFSVSIPRAQATGNLDLRTHCYAYEIGVDSRGRARSVVYFDQNGDSQEVHARQIIVACHAIGSAHLLQLSQSGKYPGGIANSNGQVGRNIMFHMDSLVQFEMDSPQRGTLGPAGMISIDNFHPSDSSRGFIRGASILELPANSPIVSAFSATAYYGSDHGVWGKPLKDYIERFPYMNGLIAFCEDLPVYSNRVDLDPDVKDRFGIPAPRITHKNHENDIKQRDYFDDKLMMIAEAAGAKHAWKLDLSQHKSGSAHIMGTCRMGDDPDTSVLNRWCQTHEVDNLWVVDSSFFPTSGGYNPTLTIVANAYRIADHFIRQAKNNNLS
ncbi:GMC family oxidoreductase [Pseudomaricurvus alkylphenolicus]|uniref:GMC family oxidoreductase n=1 Tax=Pseudomaricurvus alkylphenolicus TaxID=1306991 RepID=UPI0014241515|nr:GMC family oxidoreductase [Pseudomaricurvus alkylphenolicus]NIB40819.1 GMC family oxidoreductase [Pseudomaricurvus alkylphenolicus]